MKSAVIVGRCALAALSLAGVVTQLVIAMSGNLGVVNFFSYFTILSNIFAATVFIVSAVRLARDAEPTPAATAVRGASVVYMLFVGVVFTTLLRDVELGALQPWVRLEAGRSSPRPRSPAPVLAHGATRATTYGGVRGRMGWPARPTRR
ncbi:Pr6Pr family membrane protein [Pseudonocardia sp. GCM10023141]|uniref:Pr6Pr family membrane protein n=1 Tax=Pseudonocardia sp. GCM10023141 TaxID=3252653 RepID=UPI00361FDD7F